MLEDVAAAGEPQSYADMGHDARTTRRVESTLSSLQREIPDGLSTLNLAGLKRVLHETASWCDRSLDSSKIATSLRPAHLDSPSGVSIRERFINLPSSRWEIIGSIVSRRSRSLHEIDSTLDLPAGRALVYFPDANLFDGAAELATSGFFDVDNAPPCGTWIAYFQDRREGISYRCQLVAWIPSEIVALVSEGIAVNPEECIAWLDTTNLAVSDILKHIGVNWQGGITCG